jgi:hypothetical protein
LQHGADQIRWIRNLTFLNLILGEIIFSHYYNFSESQAQYYFPAGVLAATVAALPIEKHRRKYLKHAKQTAESAVSTASENPPLPVPNWAKKELGLNSD